MVRALQAVSYALLCTLVLGPVFAAESWTLAMLDPVGVATLSRVVRPLLTAALQSELREGLQLAAAADRVNLAPVELGVSVSRSEEEAEFEAQERDEEEFAAQESAARARDAVGATLAGQPTVPPTNFVGDERAARAPRAALSWSVDARGDAAAGADGLAVPLAAAQSEWFQRGLSAQSQERQLHVRRRVRALAEEALAKLRYGSRVPCLPLVCQRPIGFYEAEEDASKLFLVSFPGSGNTWMRHTLSQGTRRHTGSLYKDKKLEAFQNFKGEMLSPYDPKTALVKSHFPLWKQGDPLDEPMFAGAVLLLRSPFDAILAEVNRIESGQSHTGTASEQYLQSREFRAKAQHLGQLFTEFVHFWEGLNSWNHKSQEPVYFEGHGARGYNSTRVRDIRDIFSLDMRAMKRGEPFPVMTMFYEDFVRDYVQALAYLHGYLKLVHGSLAPPVYESVLCTLHHEEALDHTKRKAPQDNPFQHRQLIGDRLAEELCEQFASSWNQDKWGACTGALQRERDDLRLRSWRKDIKLPTQFCKAPAHSAKD